MRVKNYAWANLSSITFLRSLIFSSFVALLFPLIINSGQAAESPTYSVSGVSVDKTTITTGQSVTVRFNLATTNLTSFPQPLSVLFGDMSDEYTTGVAPTLISGDITNGAYTASLGLPANTPGGNYGVHIFIK